jgi:hypothetical protein
MKRILIYIFIALPAGFGYAQELGKIVEDKRTTSFPPDAYGMDIMFSESGFGLGFFYRHSFSDRWKLHADFSISESKDQGEVEYYNYWGEKIVPGKVNRVFLLPLYAGVQYRLFRDALTDNLRPYIEVGGGPTLVLTTPYEREFFSSLGYAQAKYTAGGYVGFGANFGLSRESLLGIGMRYYHIQFFDEGVRSMENNRLKELGGVYLILRLGAML